MSSLIDTALGWWRHGESQEGSARGQSKAGEKETDRDAAAKVKTPQPGELPEAPWLAQFDRLGIPRSLVYPATPLGKLLDQTADRFGAAAALIYNHHTWSWNELREQTNRFAGGLARLGVRRGERVVLTLPNCPEFVVAFFAIQKLGAVVVNAGPLMGADDLGAVLTLTSPRVVIGLDLQSPILCRAGKDSTVDHWVWVSLAFYQSVFKRIGYQFKLWHERDPQANPEQHITMEKLMAEAPSRPPSIEPDLDRPAVLQPTSGTTGTVKLVKLSHRNLLANATQIGVCMGARLAQERFMAVLPMFHVYGLTVGLITSVCQAATMVMTTRFDAADTLELIRRYKPTIFPLVPAMCDALCDELEKQVKEKNAATRIDGLRICITGAAPLLQTTYDRFVRDTGSQLIEGYGLSEAGPVTHANVASEPRFGSIGLPMPDTDCRIVDLEQGTKDVAPGECGELLVSGPQVMSGYFSNSEQTRIAMTTDAQGRAWLHTGDIVRIDEEGFFHVQDRKKDMIIRSGLKVYPAKVERLLKTHDQVADVAVIGRPDPVHTEEVIAMVVPVTPPENRQELADALRAFCRQHLAPYEVPAKVEFLDKLPRSALGKLLKKELRAMPPLGTADGNGNGNGHPHVDPKKDPTKRPTRKSNKKEAA